MDFGEPIMARRIRERSGIPFILRAGWSGSIVPSICRTVYRTGNFSQL